MSVKEQIQIKVAARQSQLSKVQVQEIYFELCQWHAGIEFSVQWMDTQGDKDKITSLRTLEKSNFFTKEVDEHILNRHCQIGIHSAKDLPDPLPAGLSIAAITKGLDSSDVLVLRLNESLSSLNKGAVIATSSIRREENVRQLRNDLHFVDIRGTIGERLNKLYSYEVDGVVIAKAALIRLSLHGLNEVLIPGETTPLQGKLAVIARSNDLEMQKLFSCINEGHT